MIQGLQTRVVQAQRAVQGVVKKTANASAAQAGGFGEGPEVLAFARPHELDIVVDADASAGIAARVSRVLAFGITARVELDGVNGARGQHFEVEITRERIERLGLAEGQAVRLLPSHLSLFESRQAATTAGAAR